MPEDKMSEDKMHDNPYPNHYAWPHPTVTGPLPFLPLYTHPLSISLSLYIKTPFVSLYTDTLYLVSLYTLSCCLTTHSLSLLFSKHTHTHSLFLSLSLFLSTHEHYLSTYTLSISMHFLSLSLYTKSLYHSVCVER